MNKTNLSWTNPTRNTDGSDYDHATQGAGYELAFNVEPDSQVDAVVSLPFALGTTFDMIDLQAYQNLPYGDHTVGLRVVSREGGASAFAVAPFRKVAIPLAPAGLAVA